MNQKATRNNLHVVIPVVVGTAQVSVSVANTQAEYPEPTSDDAPIHGSHFQVVDRNSGEVANTPQSAVTGGPNAGLPEPLGSDNGTEAELADAGLD